MTQRRFPPPWRVEEITVGYVVKDANGQSLAYVYGRETRANADWKSCKRALTPDHKVSADIDHDQVIKRICPSEEEPYAGLFILNVLAILPNKFGPAIATLDVVLDQHCRWVHKNGVRPIKNEWGVKRKALELTA